MTADRPAVAVVLGAGADFAAAIEQRPERFVHLVAPGSYSASVVRDDVDELHTVDLDDPSTLATFTETLLAPLPVAAVWVLAERLRDPGALVARLLDVPVEVLGPEGLSTRAGAVLP